MAGTLCMVARFPARGLGGSVPASCFHQPQCSRKRQPAIVTARDEGGYAVAALIEFQSRAKVVY